MPDFISDDGVRLHYVVQGSGALPVVWLHGMGGESSYWAELWRGLEAGRYRHAALDFRGHGKSDPKLSAFTAERLARDVLQLVDTLGLKRSSLPGIVSAGKLFSRSRRWPRRGLRVAGLLLLGAVGPGKVPLEREAVEPILAGSGDVAFVRECFRPWFAVWPRPEIDRWLECFARTPNWAHRAVCEIALWTDLTAETAGLAIPTLIVAGKNDPVYDPDYQRSAVLPVLPHAQVVTVECGHGFFLERPGEIVGHADRFLGSVRL